MDKCAALTTMLEQRPDKLVFTMLKDGRVALAGMNETFTTEEVEMMFQRRFGRSAQSAVADVNILRKQGVLEQSVAHWMLPPMQKTANTAVVVDMYEVDYTPRTLGESTQEIDKKLDIVKDFVTRYTFPDTSMPDVIVGPRDQVLKKKVINQSTDLPPDTGASTPLEDMGGTPSNTHSTEKYTAQGGGWRAVLADSTLGADILPGGLADNIPDSKFNPAALKKGMGVEREHSTNPQVAKEITKDHLTEDGRYYDKLQAIERAASSSSAPTPSLFDPRGRLDRVVQPGTGVHDEQQGMPHDQNFMHVAPSPLGGVGLFAYRPIKAGTTIYRTRPEEDLVVPLHKVKALPPDQQRLYHTFGVVLEGRSAIVVPKDFNHMSIIWYINHSATSPNVETPDGSDYRTTRDVLPGEELLVDYNTFDSDDNQY